MVFIGCWILPQNFIGQWKTGFDYFSWQAYIRARIAASVPSYVRFFDENSWKFDLVHKNETVEALSELVNEEIVSQVFDLYCDKLESDDFKLNREKVSRYYSDQFQIFNLLFLSC